MALITHYRVENCNYFAKKSRPENMCSCYLVLQWKQPIYRVALICKLVQFQDVLKRVKYTVNVLGQYVLIDTSLAAHLFS